MAYVPEFLWESLNVCGVIGSWEVSPIGAVDEVFDGGHMQRGDCLTHDSADNGKSSIH